MLKLYEQMQDMECLAGDTLPTFNVYVDSDDLANCRMHLIIEQNNNPDRAAVVKECTLLQDGTGFFVQLTSADTAGLSGIYKMHFRLVDAQGIYYRKLYGILFVRKAVQG